MPNFRRNHNSETRGGSSTYVRATVFVTILIALLFFLYDSMVGLDIEGMVNEVPTYEIPSDSKPEERMFLPAVAAGKSVIHHNGYSLQYNEEHEQADWVAYELTKKNLRKPNVKRSGYFNSDPLVKTKSAKHNDYTRSGYTRGHMAPAGDMAQSELTMEESFFMSNMSPQLRGLNNGIWKELEEQVRDWAYENNRLFITTGGVLEGQIVKQIGKNRVSVPAEFYKVLLDVDGDSKKGIGFIIPNKVCTKPLRDYAMSIDEVERITRIDFFADLLDPELEREIEAVYSMRDWEVNEKRFRQRVENWNNQ